MKRFLIVISVLPACGGGGGSSSPDARRATADAGGGPDAPATSCDGLGTTSGSTAVDLQTYSYSANLTACDPSTMSSFTNVIGVYDNYTVSKNTTSAKDLIPTSCNDLAGKEPSGTDPGAGSTWDGSTVPGTAPATWSHVAALKAAWPATGSQTALAIVSAVRPWTSGQSTSFYIQDPSGTTDAGVLVYVDKTIVLGAMAPAQPQLGDLVEVDGTEATYPASSGSIVGTKELAATAVKVLMSGYQIPAAVAVPAANLGTDPTMNTQLEGMRVQATGTLTVGATCPPELLYSGG
jgi:hypothetical protein